MRTVRRRPPGRSVRYCKRCRRCGDSCTTRCMRALCLVVPIPVNVRRALGDRFDTKVENRRRW
ncbi:hypothetical protein PUN28_020517 [Cardiocondyla obscurior]|uniref:Ribosomal protein S14 n=1 Tax=Cardiocondyla obscurior TaxID=286306 RepID=A0AAW2E8E4_9HYME